MEQVPRVESLSHTHTHISEGVVKLSCKGQSGRFAIGQAGLARQDPVVSLRGVRWIQLSGLSFHLDSATMEPAHAAWRASQSCCHEPRVACQWARVCLTTARLMPGLSNTIGELTAWQAPRPTRAGLLWSPWGGQGSRPGSIRSVSKGTPAEQNRCTFCHFDEPN